MRKFGYGYDIKLFFFKSSKEIGVNVGYHQLSFSFCENQFLR